MNDPDVTPTTFRVPGGWEMLTRKFADNGERYVSVVLENKREGCQSCSRADPRQAVMTELKSKELAMWLLEAPHDTERSE